MQRGLRLTGNKQFTKIRGQGTSAANRFLVIRYVPNGLDHSRFGFMVSRRIGNAVVRNKVKRRLREAVRLTPNRDGTRFLSPAGGLRGPDITNSNRPPEICCIGSTLTANMERQSNPCPPRMLLNEALLTPGHKAVPNGCVTLSAIVVPVRAHLFPLLTGGRSTLRSSQG